MLRTVMTVCILGSVWASAAVAAPPTSRPGAPHLLPGETLAYGRVANAEEFKQAFHESWMGRMLRDPQMRPLVGDLYAGAAELFGQISQHVGVSLDELLSIPQGELAVALVPLQPRDAETKNSDLPKDDSPEAIQRRLRERRRSENAFGFIAIIEAGDKAPLLEKIFDRLDDRLSEANYVRRDQEVDGTKVVRFLGPSPSRPAIEHFLRDGVAVIGIGEGLALDVLDRWQGKRVGETLAQNVDFSAALAPCVGAEDSEPQLTAFANPYRLVERMIKANGGAAALVWPIVEDLGLAKLRGIGASSFTGGEVFEGVTHLHVLLDSPRDGFLGVLRPTSGDINPPDFVPSDVMSYTAIYWDIPQAYEGLERILEKFQGEDALQRLAEDPLKQRLNVDLQPEVIEQLTGRVTVLRWMEPPARLNSQTQFWAFEVKDATAMSQTIQKVADAMPGQITREEEGSTPVYLLRRPQRRNLPEGLRQPVPCMALNGSHLMISDSREMLGRAIRTAGGSLPRLNDQPEYALVASEVGGELKGETPFLFSFVRAEEALRTVYELAKSPQTHQFLQSAGERNQVARMVAEALQRNELPPYDHFSKYFAPSGAFAYDEPTGIHYASFSLRPQ